MKLVVRTSLALTACLLASAIPATAQEHGATPGPIAQVGALEAVRLAMREPNGMTEGRQAPNDRAWSQVRQLLAGDEVRVVLGTAASYSGTFRMADDVAITLLVSGDDQRLSRAQVRQVSVAHARHRGRHVLVGMAIGAAASVVAVGLRCHGEASSCQEVAPAYFYPLAGAGATIGAFLPASKIWREVYAGTEP
jgi:hypothetical protein